MAKQKVVFAGREIDGEVLETQERQLLLKTAYDYLAGGDNFLKELFKLNENEIIATAMVAKDKFDAPIKGMLASDSEVAIQLLRPGHILRDTTAAQTPINTWDSESIESGAFTADGDYFIGFGSSNDEAVNVSQYLTLLLLGVQFTQGPSPVVEELLIQVGNTTYPVIVLRQSWVAGNRDRIRAVNFHPILVEPRQTVLGQTYSIAAGRQELVLLGLAMGPGRYLRRQSYAAADLP